MEGLNTHMMTATYNIPLVILSVAIAIFSSYTALSLASRLHAAKGNLKKIWLSAGAFSLGFGIWAMHFIAMLAFHLSIEVTYNVYLVMLSIILAVVACGIAFYIVSKGLKKRRHMLCGAAIYRYWYRIYALRWDGCHANGGCYRV